MSEWRPIGKPEPISPLERWRAIDAPEAIPMTPEQRYERKLGKLPAAAKWIAPGTMGEAGFMVGGAAAALAPLALAPETAGSSLLLYGLPLAGAAIGGALEDPKNRLGGAARETGKGVLQELGGRLATWGVGAGSRLVNKAGILERTAQRIGSGVTSLFNAYPLATPTTAKNLEDQIASGRLKDVTGSALGHLRDALKRNIPEYKPAVAPKLVEASSGVAAHFTPGSAAVGQVFILPDVEGDKIVMRHMNIADAIDHVRGLQASGWTTGGAAKSAKTAWLERETAHNAREALINQLNAVRPGIGDQYAKVSADYGTAGILEKVFVNARRTSSIRGAETGVIDQPALLKRINQKLPDISRLQGNDKAIKFRLAISPTGAEAIPESTLSTRVHGGESGLFAFIRPPIPYKPETRQLLPLPARVLSNPQLTPLLGALGLSAGQEALGEKGQ